MKHANIPIFIPHEGCQNSCVFCNQRTITGTSASAHRDIRPEIEYALKTIGKNTEVEIAFFGGSFTGIGNELMTSLLETAYGYIKDGRVKSIRLSTRPDYIDKERLDILKKYGVTHIELGIQSTSQAVLDASRRGHTVLDTENACRLICDYGFILGGQMMIGLPDSDEKSEVETAKKIVAMGAKEARIYPTVVFYGTELCGMAKCGNYTPLSIENAVERSAKVYKVFRENKVKVLRIGLQATEDLADIEKVYAGANHPALGELVIGEYFYNKLLSDIPTIKKLTDGKKSRLCIYCNYKDASKIAGQNKKNKERLLCALSEYGICDIKIIGNADFENEKIRYSTESLI